MKTNCYADHEEIFVKDMNLPRFLSSFLEFSELAGELSKQLGQDKAQGDGQQGASS